MLFRVRLLSYLMLYSAFDTATPEIVINHDRPATRPGLTDEGMYTVRTLGKVSNDMTEGTTATISIDAGRVSDIVNSAEDAVTSTMNKLKENGRTVRNSFDTVMNSEPTVHHTTGTIENITERSGVIVIERSVSYPVINNVTFVDQTTTYYDTSTYGSSQKKNDVTGIIDKESYILARKITMWGSTPIFAVVGFTCNCITAHALRGMTSSGSSTSYLRALAVADAAYNLLGVYFTIGVVLEDVGYESVRDFNVYAYPYQWLFLYRALNRISSGFTILLSAERFLAVYFPFYVKRAFLTRRPVVVITVCATVISSILLVGSFRFEARDVINSVTGRSEVMLTESKFGRDQRAFFKGYHRFSYVTFAVMPICLVFLLNVGILVKLVLMQHERKKLTSAARGLNHQITRSLLLIALLYLVTNMPALVITFIGRADQGFAAMWKDRFLYFLMTDLMTALGNLNSATNFFILTLSSSAFRSSLLALFRRSE